MPGKNEEVLGKNMEVLGKMWKCRGKNVEVPGEKCGSAAPPPNGPTSRQDGQDSEADATFPPIS